MHLAVTVREEQFGMNLYGCEVLASKGFVGLPGSFERESSNRRELKIFNSSPCPEFVLITPFSCSPKPCFTRPTTCEEQSMERLHRPQPGITSFTRRKKPVIPSCDFDSGSDEIYYEEILPGLYVPLTFLSGEGKKSTRNISPSSMISLREWIKAKMLFKPPEVYKCDYCPRTFTCAAAKGGHIAKNHSSQSLKYKQRKLSYKIRKQERNRNFYFNRIPTR